jgi:hypothetical protein
VAVGEIKMREHPILPGVPLVTDLDAFMWARMDYERDGDRAKLMTELMAAWAAYCGGVA